MDPSKESPPGCDADVELPPPGRRWGVGAQSVLPYLTRSRPASGPDTREPKPRDGNPVFAQRPGAFPGLKS